MTPSLKDFIENLDWDESRGYVFTPSTFVGENLMSAMITIPARNDSVGDLIIYDDGDELTVGIGEIYHSHFSACNYHSDDHDQSLALAIKAAAKFVSDTLKDLVYFAIEYDGKQCIGYSCGYLEAGFKGLELLRLPDAPLFQTEAAKREFYVWSGPIKNNKT